MEGDCYFTDRGVDGVQSIGHGHVERVSGLVLPHEPLRQHQAAILAPQVELLARVTVCKSTGRSKIEIHVDKFHSFSVRAKRK